VPGSAGFLEHAVSFHILWVTRSPVFPIRGILAPPGPLGIQLIGLIVGVARKFLPLPQTLSCPLAPDLSAIALVLDAWIGGEAASAMNTSALPHGFSPQETINSRAEESE